MRAWFTNHRPQSFIQSSVAPMKFTYIAIHQVLQWDRVKGNTSEGVVRFRFQTPVIISGEFCTQKNWTHSIDGGSLTGTI